MQLLLRDFLRLNFDLLKARKMAINFFDLLKVIKMTINFFDLFKVSKLTIKFQ